MALFSTFYMTLTLKVNFLGALAYPILVALWNRDAFGKLCLKFRFWQRQNCRVKSANGGFVVFLRRALYDSCLSLVASLS